MNYHIILTRRCNLNCFYCHGGEEVDNTEVLYSFDDLECFLSKDKTDLTLLFYGGEPTLRIELMTEIMNRFPKAIFMLQTNALLLHRIPLDYMKRFHSVLLSIDGRKHTTDFYRSQGVYDRVIKNVRWLESIKYPGDKVARMAVSEQTDIYKDVMHIVDLQNPSFDHVHWQLNVVWDAESNWSNFQKWVKESYKPGIEKLIDEWVRRMGAGHIEGIVPFLPVTYSLLTRNPSMLRCGSGIDSFAIHVDGTIGVCPISPDWEFSIVGNIQKTNPNQLKNTMTVDEPCPSCDIYWICGGRCLFANKQRLWGEDGFDEICKTVRHLISKLQSKIPIIEDFIEQGIVRIEEFRYPEYNNGCEIIP